MKKYIVLMLLVLGSSYMLKAQAPKKTVKMLCRAWTIDMDKLKEDLKDNELKDLVISLMDGYSMEFKEDGSTLVTIMGIPMKGTWSLNAEGNVLTTTSPSGDGSETTESKQKVEISKKRLIMYDEEGGKSEFYPKPKSK